jgi:chloramphenicol-sensitive protein RarD
MNKGPSAANHSIDRRGLTLGLAAYGFWGVLPIYFKFLAAVRPVDIVAHRVLWSMPLLILLVTVSRGWSEVKLAVGTKRTLGVLGATALLIAANWLFYVYAINTGHILAGSLGYYLNPIANVLLGRFVLKERLSRLQWVAVTIAAAGITALAIGALGQLWISLTLCATFALYGLFRKMVAVDAVAGLAIETAILLPAAVIWLMLGLATGAASFGSTDEELALLMLAGIVSTTPLLLFTAAARRLPYSTLGMLQFLAPTLQFLIAVFVYDEPFTRAHALAFGAIWTALALYVVAIIQQPRAPMIPE